MRGYEGQARVSGRVGTHWLIPCGLVAAGVLLGLVTPAWGQEATSAGLDETSPETVIQSGSAAEAVIFYIVGGLAALSALGCVLSRSVVRMAVFLFGALGSVAILYFLMAATFIGAIQLIVYAGGTLVVIVFGVMLTSKSPWARFEARRVEIVAGAAVTGVLFLALVIAIGATDFGAAQPAPADAYRVESIGRMLLTTYLVPFELASVLLLAVMVGSAYLARPEKR